VPANPSLEYWYRQDVSLGGTRYNATIELLSRPGEAHTAARVARFEGRSWAVAASRRPPHERWPQITGKHGLPVCREAELREQMANRRHFRSGP
jgi:hypothetical protein